MAAFVSESPATYDQLPFPSCSLLIWQILMVFLLTPYFPPSCHLCSQVFSSLVTSSLFFFSSCCHLNFLSSYQVWSDFPFCHKRVLEWLRAIWSESEIYVQALGLLSCQAPLSPLPLDFWEFWLSTLRSLVPITLLQNFFSFLIFSLCLGKVLLSFQHDKHVACNVCMNILKPAYPSFIKPRSLL